MVAPAPSALRPTLSTRPEARGTRAALASWGWLLLAVAVGLLFAVRTSAPALDDPFVVQDDVRQHAFWVPRLHDPALFRGDPIADYYAAVSPPGVTATYFVLTLAVDAPTASKLLPLGLTVLLAGGGFALGRALFGRADAASIGGVLLCWSAWQYDDLASASARSFAMPLLALFFAALASEHRALALLVLAVEALVYPLGCAPMLTVAALWTGWPPLREMVVGMCVHLRVGRGARPTLTAPRAVSISSSRRALGPLGAPLAWLALMTAVAGGLTLLGQLPSARYGPVVSAEQARAMPEFQPRGRSTFFGTDPYRFWLESTRSGLALVPKDPLLGGLPALTLPFSLAAGLVGWILLGRLGRVAPPDVPPRTMLLLVILGASLALFLAAHALLFRLYLPARHVQFTLPIVWALAGGLAWTLGAERLAAQVRPHAGPRARRGTVALLGLVGVGLLIAHAPPVGDFYVAGRHTRLYEYLRSLPPDTRIAALPTDSSILPLFGQRPVLVSWEHALPYHPGYYEPLRRRTQALLQAYFADSPEPILELAAREDVGVIVANLSQLERRRRDRPLALEALAQRCGAVRDRELVAIPIACARRDAGQR